ncbi:MAG: hypothetical protein NPINA01_31110 [Nitrospinaceae bacterium]|nr:MAG: hypothetical protein NPINA01_31110 [Nitrospinaceae bacterium]
MLVFKKNIYSAVEEPVANPTGNPSLDPYNFIFSSLLSDRDLFIGLTQLDPEEGNERFKLFFPHASRFGGLNVINGISKQLLEGLVNPGKWYQMNAYHLCYLYDSLASIIEEYSYESPEQRMEMFPELDGEPIDFNDFLEYYFTNTAFLIDPDRFNNMDSEEKKIRGFVDPCLFGAINRLVPSEEEIKLIETDDPYIEKA